MKQIDDTYSFIAKDGIDREVYIVALIDNIKDYDWLYKAIGINKAPIVTIKIGYSIRRTVKYPIKVTLKSGKTSTKMMQPDKFDAVKANMIAVGRANKSKHTLIMNKELYSKLILDVIMAKAFQSIKNDINSKYSKPVVC